MLQGHAPDAGEARRELADVPDGFPIESKFFYLIREGVEAVGCLDVRRGYPDPATEFLGQLLVAESFQGRNAAVPRATAARW
jgi:hypothetical protein